MFCINCFNPKTAVHNSRPHKKQPSVWRRRSCNKCGVDFTTYERPSLAENNTIQLADGKSDTFNLGRLIISISKAFQHDQNAARYQSLWLAQTIEDTLSTQREYISTDDIAAATHHVLKNFDQLAAVQYAAQHQLLTSVKKQGPGRPSLVSPVRQKPQSPSR